MRLLPGWHPLFVHFPLALGLFAAALLLAARVLPNARHAAVLGLVGTWNLVAAAIGALFALGSGLAAVVGLVLPPEARLAVGSHVKWALSAAFLLVALAVWRGAGNEPDARPSWLLLGVLAFASAALIVTGYLGGQNVYVYGIGVAALAK
jgi:uncharacterized membrane protein